MSDLLESILRSFKTTKKLSLSRNKQSLTNGLDKTTIKQLVILLKPFKHTMTLTQAENLLPLHMILLCNLKLKRALSSYESFVDYVKNYCNSNLIIRNLKMKIMKQTVSIRKY